MTLKLSSSYNFGDPNFRDVSLLLRADGSPLRDSSSEPKVITAVGNAAYSTAQKKFGNGSILFDGSGDSLSIAANAAFNPTTQDITYECWLKLNNTTPADGNTVFSVGSNSGYHQLIVRSGFIRYNTFDGTTYRDFQASVTLDNNWHHLAISKSGTTYRIFYDGANINATGAVGSSIATNALNVGSNYNVGATSVDGYIDDFRITTNIARYTTNFTPPTSQLPDFYAPPVDPNF